MTAFVEELEKDTSNPEKNENYDQEGFLEAYKDVDWLEDFRQFIGHAKSLKVVFHTSDFN